MSFGGLFAEEAVPSPPKRVEVIHHDDGKNLHVAAFTGGRLVHAGCYDTSVSQALVWMKGILLAALGAYEITRTEEVEQWRKNGKKPWQ